MSRLAAILALDAAAGRPLVWRNRRWRPVDARGQVAARETVSNAGAGAMVAAGLARFDGEGLEPRLIETTAGAGVRQALAAAIDAAIAAEERRAAERAALFAGSDWTGFVARRAAAGAGAAP